MYYKLDTSLHSPCNYYCDPPNNIHTYICFSEPETTAEEILEYYNIRGVFPISIVHNPEIMLDSMKDKLGSINPTHTKGWAVKAKINLTEEPG